MAGVSTYLNFQGNTEQTFEFYKSVLGTDYTGPMMRRDDGPADPDAPQLSDAEKRMIMQIELPNDVIDLPAPARHAVEQLLTELAAGSAVHVLADDHDMTTQEVAKLLGLSRTFVVRLIDTGKLTAHFAGTHRRVRAADRRSRPSKPSQLSCR